jgi:hypothetical protein
MKKFALVLSVFMLFAMSAGTVLATGKHVSKMETLEGKIVSVDAKAGKIVVMTTGNKEETLKASAKLTKGVVVGEKVTIEKSGTTVKSLKKMEMNPPAAK